MTVFLTRSPSGDDLLVMTPLPHPDPRVNGALKQVVRPGEDFWGVSYEELRRLGNGKHEIEPRPTQAGPASRSA